ncbi:MAG: radical SAM protein [Propionivibrio sp.]
MSFQEWLSDYRDFDFDGFFAGVSDDDVARSLGRESPGATDFLTLLSPRAGDHLEAIAQRAQQLTVQHFGRTIQMFIPLYLSNHCNNRCVYCGFNVANEIPRRVLSLAEIEREAEAIARTGMQHVLILTGEDRRATPPAYLREAVALLRKHFASVSIEIYPLHADEYRQLRAAGVQRDDRLPGDLRS